MNAVIKVPASEFNQDVFNKISAMIKSFGNSEVTIAVSNVTDLEYWHKIDKSIAELNNGMGTTFTMDELEHYIHNLSAE